MHLPNNSDGGNNAPFQPPLKIQEKKTAEVLVLGEKRHFCNNQIGRGAKMKQPTQKANAKLDEEQRSETGRSNNEHSKTVWALNRFQN